MMTLRWIPGIKRYEFTNHLFPPFATAPSSAGFHLQVFHNGNKLKEDNFKKWTRPDYLFHGRFDNRYGKKGSSAFRGAEELRLELKVNLYDSYGAKIGEVVGVLRCKI